MVNELTQIERIIAPITSESIKRRLYPDVKAAFLSVFSDTQITYSFMKIMPDPGAIRDLEQRIIILSQKTTDRLKGNLRYEILEGMQAGEGADVVGRRIKNVFDDDSVNTERIARNEIIVSSKAGRREAYEAAGVWGRRWVAVKSDRTCDVCNKLDGHVAKNGEWFKHPETGEDVLNDQAHVMCRCSTVPVMEEPE